MSNLELGRDLNALLIYKCNTSIDRVESPLVSGRCVVYIRRLWSCGQVVGQGGVAVVVRAEECTVTHLSLLIHPSPVNILVTIVLHSLPICPLLGC